MNASEDATITSSLKRKLSDDSSIADKKRRLVQACQCVDKNNCSCVEPAKLIEGDVGITEHINPVSPFTGVIKQRYSDFIVNEIDTSNTVIHLTDLNILEEEAEVVQDAVKNLGNDVVEQLQQLLKTPDSAELVEIKMLNNESKEERTKIHCTIKQNFRQLQSITEEREGVKVIIVKHKKHDNQRRTNNWPTNQPNYLKFVMYKENRDTMESINNIAKTLRMKTSSFSYSGVKDKRAKTSQLVTVYKVSPAKLAKLKLRGILLGNYEYVKTPLQLGDLNGNRFKLVLRKISGDGDLQQVLTNLSQNGFINYYGMQRFGTSSVPTHHIGRALLLGNWKEAIELIMKPRSGESEQLTECRELWWETRDAKAAYNKLGLKHIIEGHLLRGLSQSSPNDYVNALNFIPRNTRLMYIHSYQSFLWNRVASRRIKKFGLQVLNGDLYINNDDKNNSDDTKRSNDTPFVYDKEKDTNIKIFDVVMPLPGSSVILPKNEVADMYEEVLKEEDIDFKKSYSNVKSYALTGGYRKLAVLPSNMTWRVTKYDDATVPLILSDKDLLEKTATSNPSENYSEDGIYTAVCLEFSLPSSSYATMALREVINVDTSAAIQSCLN